MFSFCISYLQKRLTRWFDENFIYFVLIYPLIKISRTNKEDTRPNISFLLLIFKYSKIVLNKLLNKYDSALIKKLIKGTKAAIEIDSAKEEKIERTNTTDNSFFLWIDNWTPILLRIFRGEVEL